MSEQGTFDEWAIVELFGRVRLAGRVSEATIGGAGFIRVDVPVHVPEDEGQLSYTRFFGAAAIYSISPVTEAVARAVSIRSQAEPVSRYELSAPTTEVRYYRDDDVGGAADEAEALENDGF